MHVVQIHASAGRGDIASGVVIRGDAVGQELEFVCDEDVQDGDILALIDDGEGGLIRGELPDIRWIAGAVDMPQQRTATPREIRAIPPINFVD